jgi:hypothetical protein
VLKNLTFLIFIAVSGLFSSTQGGVAEPTKLSLVQELEKELAGMQNFSKIRWGIPSLVGCVAAGTVFGLFLRDGSRKNESNCLAVALSGGVLGGGIFFGLSYGVCSLVVDLLKWRQSRTFASKVGSLTQKLFASTKEECLNLIVKLDNIDASLCRSQRKLVQCVSVALLNLRRRAYFRVHPERMWG